MWHVPLNMHSIPERLSVTWHKKYLPETITNDMLYSVKASSEVTGPVIVSILTPESFLYFSAVSYVPGIGSLSFVSS